MLKLKNSKEKKKYLNDYRDMSKEAYKENRSSKLNNWNKIGGSSNVGIYQNKDTGEIHQSIAGSHTISDFISDLFLGTLGIKDRNFRKREAEALEMAQRIDRIKLGNKHSISSHSLGSNIATNVIHKGLGDSAVNFNPYVTQHDSHLTKHSKILNVRNSGDLASFFARNNSNTMTLDPEKKLGKIESHSLENIHFN